MNVIKNLVFEGGGILGLSYLGTLDYLYANNLTTHLSNVAGTSAGAMTAAIVSFHLPFQEIKSIADSLDYRKVLQKKEDNILPWLPPELKNLMEESFGDLPCLFRLVHNYGWYSTDYIYAWMQQVIADQFDPAKKQPPYTFADFKDPSLHKNATPFFDLSIIGTNLSTQAWEVFSYETTPFMEVALAVCISISIPLLFESVKNPPNAGADNKETNIYCDGGVMNNYPLSLFDTVGDYRYPYYKVNMETLGVRFASKLGYKNITNLVDYIQSLIQVYTSMQEQIYKSNPLNEDRSIIIHNEEVHFLDFNITPDDPKYQYLYAKGYEAAQNFFQK